MENRQFTGNQRNKRPSDIHGTYGELLRAQWLGGCSERAWSNLAHLQRHRNMTINLNMNLNYIIYAPWFTRAISLL